MKKKPIKKPTKCPVCQSKKITANLEGEMRCQRCGYIHSNKEKAKLMEWEC